MYKMKKFIKINSGVVGCSLYTTVVIFWLIVILSGFGAYAQDFQDFRVRKVDTLRGDIIMVGNNILGLTNNPPNSPYNTLGTFNGGDGFDTAYIDIDQDDSTFSSSNVDLINPNVGCARIVYAGLYWSANYYMARQGAVSTTNYGLNITSGANIGNYNITVSINFRIPFTTIIRP